MDKFYAGDNGVLLKFTVYKDGEITDLTNASVTIDFRVKTRTFTKEAVISNGKNGIVEMRLSSEDINDVGTYFFRAKVDTEDSSIHSDEGYFVVEDPTL